MSMRTALAITYDGYMHPLAAKCRDCGEEMRQPGPELVEPVDIILWFSQLYVEHRRQKHVNSSVASAQPTSAN
jgi:hypothetical protein